jgi:hypothetical protein
VTMTSFRMGGSSVWVGWSIDCAGRYSILESRSPESAK